MKQMKRCALLMVMAVVIIVNPTVVKPCLAAKIAIFPFKINAAKKMDFLQNGISDIIFARLSTIDDKKYETLRIDKKKTYTREEILKRSKKNGADYAIVGTVTIFGDNVSTNAFLYEVKTGKTIIIVNKRSDTQGTLFNTIHSFVDAVMMKTGVPKSDILAKDGSTKSEIMIKGIKDVDNLMPTEMLRSDVVRTGVNSVATGDVDGDGTIDIVFTDEHDIYVAKLKNDTFTVHEKIEGKHYQRIMGLDVLDINNNGTPEIIVTAMQKAGTNVSTFMMEWNGKKFIKTHTEKGWFLSVRKLHNTNKLSLIGQKQAYGYEIFGDNVYTVALDQKKNTIQSTGTITLPQGVGLYDFSFGNILNKGKNSLIAFAPGGFLGVYDVTMDELWKSTKLFGGSMKYLEGRKKELKKRMYLNPRIMVTDSDNDGLTEVITVRNRNSAPRSLVNLKNLVDGHVACLVWKGYGLVTKWKTPVVNGYIPDFDIVDIDKDGVKELIYCVVVKTSDFFNNKQSYFVIQKISGSQ